MTPADIRKWAEDERGPSELLRALADLMEVADDYREEYGLGSLDDALARVEAIKP